MQARLKLINLFLVAFATFELANIECIVAQVVQIIPFISNVGGRVDWAKRGIVYDHLNLNGYYSVSKIQPDGSAYSDLTKNKPGCPQKNNGNPAIYPSGRYVVFQAEKDADFDSADIHFGPSLLSTPGSGINCDLWVLNLQDSVFTRLTDIPTKQTSADTTKLTGVLHPQFSHDGKKLLWGECLDASSGDGFGFWRLNISDFDTSSGFPQLLNTAHYDSGGVLGHYTFIETSGGFSPSDSVIIYCANAIEGQPVDEMDIYTFNFYTQQLVNLTPDTLEYDEHSHFNYDGTKVLWMSSRNVPDDSLQNPKTDYWLMNNDGSDKIQLTYFNDSTSADYKNFSRGGRIIASDNTWSPFGGDTALCYIQIYDSAGNYHQEDVFLIIPPTLTSVNTLISHDSSIFCFPNPSSTTVNIRIPQKSEIEILNVEGQIIKTITTAESVINIDISDLAAGMYFIMVKNEKGLETKKFIKQ